MKIISADERLAERRGAKVLLLGPPGIGKTSQLRKLVQARPLFLENEAGDLAVLDVPIPSIRIDTWQLARDVAVRIGGPNKSFPPTACYSQAHYEAAGGALENLDEFDTIFIDSFTGMSRLSFRWAEQQPEALTDRGRKDLRAIYGLHARELLLWVHQLQHVRSKHVIFVGILEFTADEFKRGEWGLQVEGQKTARELPGIVDEVVTYQFLDFGDGKPPTRGFVCVGPNRWNYPAKDRSGRLNQIEPPDLGKLLTKLTSKPMEISNG
jgi:hypothetical protein